MPKFLSLVVAIALALGVSGGHAATVTYSTTLPVVVTANPLASATLGPTAVLDENVSGSVVNQRLSPWAAANSTLDPLEASSVYSSLRSTTASTASAVFDFASVMRSVSFVWGTPGPLNRVELLLGGASQLVLTGAVPQGQSGTLSVFTQVTDVAFDQLVFSAGRPSFEYANLTVAAVPLPAGVLLLLSALGGMVMLHRRRSV